jgi:dihydrofolate synthase/folylpolyglutamate synthase
MEHLGDTIAAIAREKAGIIKRGDRAVTGAVGDALDVIRRRARRVDAPLSTVQPLPVARLDTTGTVVRHAALGEVRVGLLGRHQAANAAVALAIIEALGAAGIARVDEAAIRAGLAAVRWPGRLELLTRGSDGPAAGVDVLLDGAHNAAGAAALASAVEDLSGSLAAGRATLLLGMLRDKEVAAMLAALRGSTRLAGAGVITTAVPDSPRALSAAALAAAWGAGAVPVEAVVDALGLAIDQARSEGGALIVAGSLYLVGAVRAVLVPEAPTDTVAERRA